MPRKLVTMLACFGLFGISGCSEPELMLPGERIAVTQQVEHLSANQQAMAEGAGLSAPLTTLTASHPGLNAGHAGGHLALDLPLDANAGMLRLALVVMNLLNWRCRWLALGMCLRYLHLARYQP